MDLFRFGPCNGVMGIMKDQSFFYVLSSEYVLNSRPAFLKGRILYGFQVPYWAASINLQH